MTLIEDLDDLGEVGQRAGETIDLVDADDAGAAALLRTDRDDVPSFRPATPMPKKRGPDQCVPVISRAISVSDR